ncbi:hypothetical protein K435DRAFT_777480 [Dendrothele bispora CBS 962.96]|uniref:DUF6534 domain-containing protein n=1 Tax=Dendrothele bispora (strain CBS 962.96) TaxID=1314807 RepID=A0A4S8M837_DENBC|nr:hypothetical protein K435DRAFT_777480 [Dendrothele bispora CBS 962.96]
MSGLPDRQTPVTQGLFEETYGASYICAILTVFLFGISVLQGYMYYLKYSRDSPYLKLLVFSLLAMGTVHTALICHTVYHYLVLSYTRPEFLIDGEWSVYTSSVLGSFMCFIIQMFFANMIFHLTKSRWWGIVLAGTIVLLSLAQFAFGVFFTTREFQLWQLAKLAAIVHITQVPMLAFRIITDILICVSLCYTLWDSRTEIRRTTKLINMLIVYAINRFVLTTLVVIVQMIVLITKPQSIGAMVIEFVTVHLYVNSLLATLNSRNHLRNIGNDRVNSDSNLSSSDRYGKFSSVRFVHGGSTTAGQQQQQSLAVLSSQAPTSSSSGFEMSRMDDVLDVNKEGTVGIQVERYIMSDLSESIQRKKPGEEYV